MTRIAVVGIGADGWPGLGEPARAAILGARTIFGSERQLALLPAEAAASAGRWPSPIEPLLDELARSPRTAPACSPAATRCSTASARRSRAGSARSASTSIRIPRPFALACARLGWPAADVELVSAVGAPGGRRRPRAPARPPDRRLRHRRATARATLARVARRARLRRQRGSSCSSSSAARPSASPRRPRQSVDARRRPAPRRRDRVPATGPLRALVPGLPDDAYEHDGQLTKRDVRAITLAALAPAPGAAAVGRRRGQRLDRHRMAARPSRAARAIARRAATPTRAERIDAQRRSPSACPTG